VGAGLKAREALQAVGWTEQEAGLVSLAIVELCTNAVRHAQGGTCQLSLGPGAVTVVVDDEGKGFPAWLLERFKDARPIEAHFAPLAPHRPSGLGAGLDTVRRLASRLALDNRRVGARAEATFTRAMSSKSSRIE
jgi:anti-sigma regulatory factor (Ser/Thr protein kinase)